ncbi:MAG: hypothetical protein AB7O98_03400 [Hyphomonadaceae bacterium]
MRTLILAVVSAVALAACGQGASNGESVESNAADAGGGAFPNLANAAYRAEVTATGENGDSIPVVMIRDGAKMRMEFTSDDGQTTLITDGASGESFVLTNAGGNVMAIRASGLNQGLANPTDVWGGELAERATRTGTCSVAGENGSEWTEANGTDTACVTDDGIILRATDDGRTVWEATSVSRGPQDAALFQLPEGVRVMDLGNVGAAMNDALARAKAGN